MGGQGRTERSRNRGARFALIGLALLCLAGLAAGSAEASPFDKPVKTTVLPLPPDPQNPTDKAQLSCFYFARFMVKEVDLGEVGAEQLSILPFSGGASPPCKRENAADERVLADWSGYYKGVVGDYVFLDADDGWNDGLGFAVYTATDGKKIFDDTAKTWHSIKTTAAGLVLRYERVYGAPCSLEGDKPKCWARIREETGLLGDTAPDCLAAYQREQARTPTFATQVLDDPTILDYEVAVTVAGGKAAYKPVTGKAFGCRPAE